MIAYQFAIISRRNKSKRPMCRFCSKFYSDLSECYEKIRTIYYDIPDSPGHEYFKIYVYKDWQLIEVRQSCFASKDCKHQKLPRKLNYLLRLLKNK